MARLKSPHYVDWSALRLWTSDFDIMEVLSGHSDFIEMREPYSKAAWVCSGILLDIWQIPNDSKIPQNPFKYFVLRALSVLGEE